MEEVNIESHNMGSTFYRLTSLSMSIGYPIHKISLFKNLTLKIQGQGHGWGKVESHNIGPTFYRLTSLWFHINRPSHSWDTIFSKFDLENPKSRSWVRGTLKVTTWVQHSIVSHPLNSMSIGHGIPELRLFKKSDLRNPRSRSWVRGTLKVTKWV